MSKWDEKFNESSASMTRMNMDRPTFIFIIMMSTDISTVQFKTTQLHDIFQNNLCCKWSRGIQHLQHIILECFHWSLDPYSLVYAYFNAVT